MVFNSTVSPVLRCACAKFKSTIIWIGIDESATTAAALHTTPRDWISFHKFGEYFPGTGVSVLFRLEFSHFFSTSAQHPIVVELRNSLVVWGWG